MGCNTQIGTAWRSDRGAVQVSADSGITAHWVSEGTAATFTLTRTAPYTDALTVNVSVSQTGEFIEMENSY